MILTTILLLTLQGASLPGAPSQPQNPRLNDTLMTEAGAIRDSMRAGFTIMGKLKFPDGVAPSTIEVTLEGFDDSIVDKTPSLPNGDFRFRNVKVGRYYLVVSGERFDDIREPLNIEAQVGTVIDVTLSLRPRNGAVKSAGTINVANLMKPPKDAVKEFEKGNFQKVIDIIRGATGKPSPDTLVLLGTAYFKVNDLEQAEKNLQQALTISADTPDAYLQLFNVYIRSRQPEKALQSLDTYLERFPAAKDRDAIKAQAERLRKTLKP